jgi:purine-binding chemotaxis protein CheW
VSAPPNAIRPRSEATPEEPTVQLCAFWVGAEEYVIDVMRLDEVLRPQKLTPVAGAPRFVQGVVKLRGGIVPVIDLRARLGAGPPQAGRKERLVICRVGRGRLGLRVDGIAGVVRAKRSEIRPPPMSASSGEQSSPIVGVWGPPERLRLLLNVKALLAGEDGAVPG